jgi:hypothetical protein
MADRSTRGARVWFVVAVMVGLLVVAWAAGRPPRDGDPLDPRSSGELGARGLVLFLEEMGAEVQLSQRSPTAASDVTVVLDDRLTESTRSDVGDWVEDGGTLVVADPGSLLSAPPADQAGGLEEQLTGDLARGRCDIVALAAVEDLDAPGALLYDVAPDAASCFGDDEAAYVVSGAAGNGTVVSVGSPTVFLNDSLDDRDHAALAGALLVPEPGTRVTILEDPPPGEGDDSLEDLVPDGVKAALVQLAIAFVVYALFRARRLGRPVPEPLPVQIAGSELVVAVGGLIQQSGDPERAATVLRDDTRRNLARRLGLPVDAAPAQVADAVAARVGADRDHVLDLLTRRPVPDEKALVDLAHALEAIRQETLHGQSV